MLASVATGKQGVNGKANRVGRCIKGLRANYYFIDQTATLSNHSFVISRPTPGASLGTR